MKKQIIAAMCCLVFVFGTIGCKSTTKNESKDSVTTNTNADLEKFMNLEGLPIAKAGQNVTLKVFVGTNANALNPKDMRWTKQVEEATGIKIEWVWYSESAAGEKARLMLLGAEELPDIFMNTLNRYEIVQYMNQGIFRPVGDLIEKWMPNLAKVFNLRPQYKSASVAPDGNIYGFPYIEEMYGLGESPGPIYIYKPWLDALKLKMPTTLDEYRHFLELVKTTDLNENGLHDEIPLTFQVGGYDSYEGYHQIISCFGINDMYNHLSVVNSKVVNTTTLNEFKLGIDYVNKMYKDGLIDSESFMPTMSGDPRARVLSKINNKDVIVASAQLFDPMGEVTVSTERRNNYVALPRLTGPNGGKQGIHYNQNEMTSATRCVITAKCKYPELAARWIDYFYNPEQSVYLNWGTEGYVYKKDTAGLLKWDVDQNGEPNLKEGYESMNEMRWASTPVYGGLAILTDYYDKVVEFPLDAALILKGQKDAGLDEYLKEREYLPPVWLLTNEIETLTQYETYVNNLVNSNVTKWLMEGGVNEDWDKYQSQLKEAGLDNVIKVYQDAYDRYQVATKTK